MLQKLNTVSVLAAVLTLSTAALFVQKPELGLAASSQPQIASIEISDPSAKELFEPIAAGKLASALEAIENMPEPTESPEPTTEPGVRVASIDASDDNEVFVDTINNTLPPVFDGGAKPAPAPAPSGDVVSLIHKYAAEYGVSAEIMIGIANCESGMNAGAVSPSGSYKGIYQFVTSTWQSNREAMGLSADPALMFNAEEAVRTAAFKMSRDGYGAWPVCSQNAMNALALK